jgi:hypothetical protein
MLTGFYLLISSLYFLVIDWSRCYLTLITLQVIKRFVTSNDSNSANDELEIKRKKVAMAYDNVQAQHLFRTKKDYKNPQSYFKFLTAVPFGGACCPIFRTEQCPED